MTRRYPFGLIALMVAIAACTMPAAGSPTPGGPTAAPSPSPSATAAVSSPSASVPASAAASGTTACLDRQLFELIRTNIGSIGSLTPDQRNQIAAALERLDLGTSSTAVSWRQRVVAALRAGAFPNQFDAQIAAAQFAAGEAGVRAC